MQFTVTLAFTGYDTVAGLQALDSATPPGIVSDTSGNNNQANAACNGNPAPATTGAGLACAMMRHMMTATGGDINEAILTSITARRRRLDTYVSDDSTTGEKRRLALAADTYTIRTESKYPSTSSTTV